MTSDEMIAFINDRKNLQQQMIPKYAEAIEEHRHTQDFWPAVNGAIIDRWSRTGLHRIKKAAWEMVADQKRKARDEEGFR